MRKLILVALLFVSVLCHANSVKIGPLTLVGNNTFQATITAQWLACFTQMPGNIIWSLAGKNCFFRTGPGIPYIYGSTDYVIVAQLQASDLRSINVRAVPESGTLMLLGTGMLGIGLTVRRRWNGQKFKRSESPTVEIPLAVSTKSKTVTSAVSRNCASTSANRAMKKQDCAA